MTRELTLSIVVGIIALIIGYQGALIASDVKYMASCNIPSPEQVRDYCQAKQYDSGWVSQVCNANEVRCYRQIGDLLEYKCIKWVFD